MSQWSDRRIVAAALIMALAILAIAARLFVEGNLLIATYASIIFAIYQIARGYLITPDVSRNIAIVKVASLAIAAIVSLGSLALPLGSVADILEPILRGVGVHDSLLAAFLAALRKASTLQSNTFPLLVSITAIALVAVITLGKRKDLLAHTATGFGVADVKAIRSAVHLQLDRIAGEVDLVDGLKSAIPLTIEEDQKIALGLRRKTLLNRLQRAADNSIFLLSGEPGSGKSFALREVTRRLADELSPAGKIPVYLNLRDWLPPQADAQHQYNQNLSAWIRQACLVQISTELRIFADETMFQRLYASGRFVFLLDSFDEISSVAAAPRGSNVVKLLSNAIAVFIKSSGGCVAVIASREYRSPQLPATSYTSLTILPFNDAQARKYITKAAARPQIMLGEIYSERPDLYALTRNPFLLALAVHHHNTHGTMPASEYELYETFVVDRLARISTELGLDAAVTGRSLEHAMQLAQTAIDPKLSTETIPDPASAEADVLIRSGILSLRDGKVRFAHRRLLEYLRVRHLLVRGGQRPKLARGVLNEHYDLLVLYASVCKDRTASALAAEAVRQVRQGYSEFEELNNHEGYRQALMALRFLRDAFRSRSSAYRKWQRELRSVIVRIWTTGDLMRQKHAVEHLSLLPDVVASQLVSLSLDLRCGWLKRAALFEARYLPSLQPGLGIRIGQHISTLPDLDFGVYLRLFHSTNLLRACDTTDKLGILAEATLRALIYVSCIGLVLVGGPYAASLTFGLVVFAILWGANSLTTSIRFSGGFSGVIALTTFWTSFWKLAHSALGTTQNLWPSSSLEYFLCVILNLASALVWLRALHSRLRLIAWEETLRADAKALVAQLSLGHARVLQKLQFFIFPLLLVGLLAAESYSDTARSISHYLPLFFLIIVGADLVYVVAKGALSFVGSILDRWTLRNLKTNFVPSRSSIEGALHQLITADGRYDFLQWLDKNTDLIDHHLRRSEDNWTNLVRPNFNEHYLNNYLAMLDERWRGLSRR